MGYSFSSRVRYSETGENGCLTLPGILDYFQDTCTFQSESINQGMLHLRQRNRAWVLGAWHVVVQRYPSLGEEILTQTIPYQFKGCMGLRNFIMQTPTGERLAWANSHWANINTQTGMPVRLTEEDTRGYELGTPLQWDFAPRRIRLPESGINQNILPEPEKGDPFQIQHHHLDSHRHVNNCQYVRMAMDYLPAGRTVSQLRVEYMHQALLGDTFYPFILNLPDRQYVLFQIKPEWEADAYAVVELVFSDFLF